MMRASMVRLRPPVRLAPALLLVAASGLWAAGCRPENSAWPIGGEGDAGRSRTDLATDPGPRPARGEVGVGGGVVDRLHFGFTGDTRPSDPDQTALYPVATIRRIFERMAAAEVQFAVDLGDHMYVVSDPSGAPVQMGYYNGAAARLGRPLFMTLGNHDCNQINCFYARSDPNFSAFMEAHRAVAPEPNYRFTVMTRSGPAVFVVIADNFFDAQSFEWLERALAEADRTARYTIVARHHPLGYDSVSTLATERIVRAHKYSLLLTGHAHAYTRDRRDPSGRTLIYGLGGVPSSGPGWGYGTVMQGLDDKLYVTIYDQASGLPIDGWSVPPQ